MFIQGAGRAEHTYDAIVVGSGISGGWAAKELTEKGLRTLVLERGRDVKHPDYPTATKESWEFAGRNRPSAADIAKQAKQNRTGYTTHPASAHWFVNDVENPYSEVKRFDWMRGYHVRGGCQYRNRCIRGCPYGAYFSSNASTLPAAYATGKLTLRPFSIVTELIYDPATKKATGVRIVDAETNQTTEYFARVIFLCASTVASTFILLNSVSDRFPNGFGNDSGELGHNLMDHHFKVGAGGLSEDFGDRFYKGQRPNGIYIPRFRNLDAKSRQKDYIRGFGYQGSASRDNWARGIKELSHFGADLKADLIAPGPWRFGIGSWGECLPYHDNRLYLNKALRDKWGLPTVTFDAGWKTNELNMRKDMMSSAAEMLEAAGLKSVTPFDDVTESAPGNCIHEMGTARMGRDPKTSVLNGWNQVHTTPNVFVTDGSCMASASCVNPSLTYMALTARACDHAFIDLLYAEVMTTDERQMLAAGLDSVDAAARAAHGGAFITLTADRQDTVLRGIARAEEGKDQAFFRLIRSATILGYFTSEPVGRNVLHYDPVPGRYEGCVPIDQVGNRTWTG